MGVYVFQSIHAPYIKVGHYCGKNAFSRIAHRGFSSCVCPQEIRDRVSMDDMELVAWFPNQTRKTEQTIKKKWKHDRIGEWLSSNQLRPLLDFLRPLEPDQAHQCDPFEAILSRRRL